MAKGESPTTTKTQSLSFQTDDKKFLNQLAYDKRHLEKLLHKLTEQKDTPTKYHGTIQKQVRPGVKPNGFTSLHLQTSE